MKGKEVHVLMWYDKGSGCIVDVYENKADATAERDARRKRDPSLRFEVVPKQVR